MHRTMSFQHTNNPVPTNRIEMSESLMGWGYLYSIPTRRLKINAYFKQERKLILNQLGTVGINNLKGSTLYRLSF